MEFSSSLAGPPDKRVVSDLQLHSIAKKIFSPAVPHLAISVLREKAGKTQFVSTEGYSLGSIDVSDAYLQVEQVEPTIVTVGNEDFELGFTLPGQSIGSSA